MSGTDSASFDRYPTASRSCAESHGTSRNHSNDWQSSFIHWWTQGLAKVVIPIHSAHGVRLRRAATEEDKITVTAVVKQSFDDHNLRLYLGLALLCN